MMELSIFQQITLSKVREGKSVLLIAPTGLGKTLAVTADLKERYQKTIYATPLRALGNDILREIKSFERKNGKRITSVIHHGDIQDSNLFTEEVVVTTYDQIVCAVPGLPLSLPLKAGHAIAGATLLSRLIFDEGHLTWGISKDALSILLGVISFRKRLGIPTILMTATLPKAVAEKIAHEYEMELLVAGEEALIDDEALQLRNLNRKVIVSRLSVAKKGILDFSILAERLITTDSGIKKIYFGNTVDV